MIQFSVFTPSHDPQFLEACYDSLLAQTLHTWEWIVVLNAGAKWSLPADDGRVRVIAFEETMGVGKAKSEACAIASGTYLVELDHDDVLLPTALQAMALAFENNADAVLVYSHCAQILKDGTRDSSHFDMSMGWNYKEHAEGELELTYAVSFEPTPNNVSYIWFAPNHVRAFRHSAYREVGGYDPDLEVLDDQDLMSRLYQHGAFHLVDECLYLQRMHDANTQSDPSINEFIQTETVRLYDLHFEANAIADAQRRGLALVELNMSMIFASGTDDLQHSSDARLFRGLDLEDNSVGVVRAIDVLQRCADKVGLMNELYRVLAPGGILISRTPSTDGRGAFQDPTHVAYFNDNSFWYFTDQAYGRFVPGLVAKFQNSRTHTLFPSEWHREHNISYVYSNLIAVKEGMARNGGQLSV